MDIVELTWLDAIGEDAELELEAALRISPVTRHQVGFVLAQDDFKVTIAFGTYPTGFWPCPGV